MTCGGPTCRAGGARPGGGIPPRTHSQAGPQPPFTSQPNAITPTSHTVTDDYPKPQIGRYNHFQGGSIYWTPATSAHETHGAIRGKWAALGWERSFLGYPTSDELVITGGRLSKFQGAYVYWSPATWAHEVHGAILGTYLQLGASNSRLGFPITDESPMSTGRYSNFQQDRKSTRLNSSH